MNIAFIIQKLSLIKVLFLLAFFTKQAFSADYIETAQNNTSLVALGSFQGKLLFFDLISNNITKQIKAHNRTITDISFSADGKKLATTGADGVKIWDLPTMTLQMVLPYQANNASFNPKNQEQVLISGYGLIVIVDINSGEKILNIPHKSTARANFDHQGEQIVITDFNQSLVLVFSLKSNLIIYSISEHWPMHSIFSQDDQKIIVSADKGVHVYHLNQNKVQNFTHAKSFSHDDGNWILRSEPSSRDRQITSIDNAGCLLKLDLVRGTIASIESRSSMKFSSFYDEDKKILAVTSNQIFIYDAQNMNVVQQAQVIVAND